MKLYISNLSPYCKSDDRFVRGDSKAFRSSVGPGGEVLAASVSDYGAACKLTCNITSDHGRQMSANLHDRSGMNANINIEKT